MDEKMLELEYLLLQIASAAQQHKNAITLVAAWLLTSSLMGITAT